MNKVNYNFVHFVCLAVLMGHIACIAYLPV